MPFQCTYDWLLIWYYKISTRMATVKSFFFNSVECSTEQYYGNTIVNWMCKLNSMGWKLRREGWLGSYTPTPAPCLIFGCFKLKCWRRYAWTLQSSLKCTQRPSTYTNFTPVAYHNSAKVSHKFIIFLAALQFFKSFESTYFLLLKSIVQWEKKGVYTGVVR